MSKHKILNLSLTALLNSVSTLFCQAYTNRLVDAEVLFYVVDLPHCWVMCFWAPFCGGHRLWGVGLLMPGWRRASRYSASKRFCAFIVSCVECGIIWKPLCSVSASAQWPQICFTTLGGNSCLKEGDWLCIFLHVLWMLWWENFQFILSAIILDM